MESSASSSSVETELSSSYINYFVEILKLRQSGDYASSFCLLNAAINDIDSETLIRLMIAAQKIINGTE